MKKGFILLATIVVLGCTNQKVVQYNTARLDNIEEYLRENKGVKASDNVDKLVEEGKIEYAEEYKSLEKEAEAWVENRQK
ncbi:hypothetical protein EGX98_01015 [Fusobacterium necrophorum]|uniref:Lipoprotein n=1 Tax=Fusobacterium necrophorum DJ-2 TaxID=1441737 RepID=A0AB73C582_9FUSO|nr:hypothetical protein [Fusobacterium necrophorum]AYZ72774.1 hypothetical protein EGX98_01015 [Fusobacterium necrophorum]AZW09228.1 hypothetical protein EO219_06370 [Fusobacterium necrophorum subsp. necrophorum]KDE63005.1 hypothetical protein FUSO4_09990 [Fusobacterium necrophorum DJ-1]KDE64767.1 hypothetical protein FUSO5_05885 [Fusobacterium necrophorum BFTR-1]KDE68937.1 hypothetical protein FUSO6_07580 [Fusobacterium necrophorum DAB]